MIDSGHSRLDKRVSQGHKWGMLITRGADGEILFVPEIGRPMTWQEYYEGQTFVGPPPTEWEPEPAPQTERVRREIADVM